MTSGVQQQLRLAIAAGLLPAGFAAAVPLGRCALPRRRRPRRASLDTATAGRKSVSNLMRDPLGSPLRRRVVRTARLGRLPKGRRGVARAAASASRAVV
jgi:hypothetical protein